MKTAFTLPTSRQSLKERALRVAYEGVQAWLRHHERSPLIEHMKDQSSYLIRRLSEYQPFIDAVEAGDEASIRRLLGRACYNGQKLAFRASRTVKGKLTVSHDQLMADGFDPSIRAHNDDQELGGMPPDPHDAIEWVKDDALVRATSRLHPDLTEGLLALKELPRQVILLYWTTKYSAKVIAELLKVSESKVTNIAHRSRALLRSGQGPQKR